MLRITDLKPGILIELDGNPFLVLSSSWKLLGRGRGMTKTKLRNLQTGAIIERVFRGNDVVKEANLIKTKAIFLYKEKDNFYFMEKNTFNQFSLSGEVLGFSKNFLKEGAEIEMLNFSGKPININMPIKVNLRVQETEAGIKGGRETAGTKKAVLETGFVTQVPLFIKNGDVIKVDTRDGKYIERVK